jgi:uncharacterized protein YfaT (DUF1175 family)
MFILSLTCSAQMRLVGIQAQHGGSNGPYVSLIILGLLNMQIITKRSYAVIGA